MTSLNPQDFEYEEVISIITNLSFLFKSYYHFFYFYLLSFFFRYKILFF